MATRKAPLIRCQCGRQHRSWNPHKVCNACVRDARSEVDAELAVRVRELETRHERLDVNALLRVHERWLARQPADHPFRRGRLSEVATCVQAAGTAPGTQLTIDTTSRVASGGGEA